MSAGKIFELIESGDTEGLRGLLEQEPEAIEQKSPQGVSAVLFACYQMKWELIPLLREAARGMDLFEAAAVGDLERLRALLQSQPEAVRGWTEDGFSALHLAAFFRQPNAVGLLIEAGADIDAEARNGSGLRPINSAAASTVVDSVRILLEAGADPDVQQAGGYTALHSAAHNDNLEMAQALIDAGADTTLRTDEGRKAAEMAPESSAIGQLLPR